MAAQATAIAKKPKTSKRKEPKVSEVMTVAAAAKECDLPYKTLTGAVSRSAIPCFRTVDGLPLVLLDDVKEFAANRPKKGRPIKVDKK